MHGLLRLLETHDVPSAAAKAIAVVALFVVASLIARAAGFVVGRLQASSADAAAGSPLLGLARRRETSLSLAQTSIRYGAFLLALALALVTITGARDVSTLAGASFVAIVIAFAAQRFLIDMIAGFLMLFEGWYTVGSTIVIEPMKLEGVVEEVSLRATTLREVSGELVRVHNSQVLAVRTLPGGIRRVEIELFVRDREAGEELVDRVARVVPTGPTSFVKAPAVRSTQQLDDDLHRVTAEAAVAAGRLWLAEDLLPSLLKERSEDDLIVHGPVVLPVDEQARTRFARAERRLRERAGGRRLFGFTGRR